MEKNSVIRDIYVSDIILRDNEVEMMNHVDTTYLDLLEGILDKAIEDTIIISSDEIHLLEDKFNDFYFEYGYVQFKRGIELGLSLRNINEV